MEGTAGGEWNGGSELAHVWVAVSGLGSCGGRGCCRSGAPSYAVVHSKVVSLVNVDECLSKNSKIYDGVVSLLRFLCSQFVHPFLRSVRSGTSRQGGTHYQRQVRAVMVSSHRSSNICWFSDSDLLGLLAVKIRSKMGRTSKDL